MYKNPLNSARPLSSDAISKITKEKLKKTQVKTKELDRSEPGIKNHMICGEHNKNFNKYCL